MRSVAIVGAGPAGLEAALYAKALTLTGAVLLTASTKNGIHDEILLGRSGVDPAERLGLLET